MKTMKKIAFTLAAALVAVSASAKNAVNDRHLDVNHNHVEAVAPDKGYDGVEGQSHFKNADEGQAARLGRGAKKAQVSQKKCPKGKKKGLCKSKRNKKRYSKKAQYKKVYKHNSKQDVRR